jgi:hypothetical protein
MDKKTLTIILAAILIGSFFLPYVKSPFGSVSGLDILTAKGGDADKYIMALVPLSGILLLIGALNNGNYILPRGILCLLALVGVLYLVVRSLIKMKGEHMDQLFSMLGIGYWLGLATAIVLNVYKPKD